MKKLMMISAAVLVSTSAFGQTTVVTTTGTGHSGTVQIEPEYRTKIRSYVTEHKIRPVETGEDRGRLVGAARRRTRGGTDRVGPDADEVSLRLFRRARDAGRS